MKSPPRFPESVATFEVHCRYVAGGRIFDVFECRTHEAASRKARGCLLNGWPHVEVVSVVKSSLGVLTKEKTHAR